MNKIQKTIKSSGGRLTKIKKEIIDIFLKNHCLLTKAQLVKKLNSKQLKPNRSTIYRKLHFLTKNNIVTKSTILGVDYYEFPKKHHHHLVCLNCNTINKFEIGKKLEEHTKQIAKQKNFDLVNHSLEFYGYCQKCQI